MTIESYSQSSPAGEQQLVARGGKEGEGITLELWKGSRVVKELQIPKDLHGSIYNDNWFSLEPAWNADETRIAYVAEVRRVSETEKGLCLLVSALFASSPRVF